jgi:hypothetical protein
VPVPINLHNLFLFLLFPDLFFLSLDAFLDNPAAAHVHARCKLPADPAKKSVAFGGMPGSGLFPGMPQADAEGGAEGLCWFVLVLVQLQCLLSSCLFLRVAQCQRRRVPVRAASRRQKRERGGGVLVLLRLQCILHSFCLFLRIAQCQRRCGLRYATSCLRTWRRGALGCDISPRRCACPKIPSLCTCCC